MHDDQRAHMFWFKCSSTYDTKIASTLYMVVIINDFANCDDYKKQFARWAMIFTHFDSFETDIGTGRKIFERTDGHPGS